MMKMCLVNCLVLNHKGKRVSGVDIEVEVQQLKKWLKETKKKILWLVVEVDNNMYEYLPNKGWRKLK